MSRALRAQRKGVVEQKRAVFEDFEQEAEDDFEASPGAAEFTLLDGTPVSAAAPWPTLAEIKKENV
jgi:hypothetical protein